MVTKANIKKTHAASKEIGDAWDKSQQTTKKKAKKKVSKKKPANFLDCSETAATTIKKTAIKAPDDLNAGQKKRYLACLESGLTKLQSYKDAANFKPKKKAQKKKVVKKKAAKKKAIKIENNQSAGKRVNNGGARKGAGRKKGATTKKTREIADKLAAEDEITPLEYLLAVLRETPEKLKAKFDAGDITSEEFIVELQAMQKRKDNAAEKAAPYIHPRLSSIEAKVKGSGHEEWLAMMAELEANK